MAQAAAPACVAAGKVPAGITILPAEPSAAGLSVLAWNAGQTLMIREVRALTGDCRDSVTGFAGSTLLFKGGLAAGRDESGAWQVARAAPRLPGLPQMNESQHDHDEEEGHTHSDSGFGEFVTGAHVAVKRAPQGATAFFVGGWRQGADVHTVAVFARNPQGMLSPPAALLRSQFPVRGISYMAETATTGLLGITLEAPGELRLIDVEWTHPDFSL